MKEENGIEKFMGIYKARFGKEITREEAEKKGATLIRLIELIYTPMKEKELQLLQERQEQTGDIKK